MASGGKFQQKKNSKNVQIGEKFPTLKYFPWI